MRRIKKFAYRMPILNDKDMEPISYENYFLQTNNVNVALITETCLHPNTKLNFSNYDIIWYDFPRVIADGLVIIINSFD